MYPRNAAAPERIAVGAVVQISDGVVQTSAVVITVRGQGGAEGTGGGTTVFGASGIVYYTPTQGETNFTSFTVIASKTGCVPVAQTIITTASVTPGQVRLEGVTHTGAVVPTVSNTAQLNGAATVVLTDASLTTAKLGAFALAKTTNITGFNDIAAPAGFAAATFPTGTIANTTNITAGTIANLTNLPTIPANWITAAGITAGALNGKGDWNIGKTGYSLTQAFPANFSALSITAGGLVDITQAAADKAWGTGTRLLTAGTNIVLAKGVGVTGFNDIAATAVVSAGAINTASGAVSSVTTVAAVTGLTPSNLDATVSSRLATAGYTAPNNAGITANGAALVTIQADTDDIQTRLPAALVSGRMDSSVEAMAANTLTAAALAADAVQEIADAIDVVATSAALSKRTEAFVPTTATVAAGTFSDTFTVNSAYHQLQDIAGTLDVYYEFDIGVNGAPVGYTHVGRVTSANDIIGVYAWNWGASSWEQIGNLVGAGGSTDLTRAFNLLVAHVGSTGADLGKVRIRLFATGLTSSDTYTDQQFVSYAVVPAQIGFVGAVQAATSTTIDLPAAASAVDEYYFPGLVVVVSGTGRNQFARVSAYDGTLKRITVATPMAVTLDTTSVILISPWGSTRTSAMDPGVVDAAALSTDAVTKIRDSILPKKNVAFADIGFIFVDSVDHVTPVTGATGTAVTRSINGGAFGAGTGTLAEVGNGLYQYDASAADMNGRIITFRFTATGGAPNAPDDTFVTVVTSG